MKYFVILEKSFQQRQGMCGLESMREALNTLGIKLSRKQAEKLAPFSARGIEHKQLISAIKKAGANVEEHYDLSEERSIALLKKHSKANPIIIDWMKTKLSSEGNAKAAEGMKPGVETGKSRETIAEEENEHFSVITSIDDKYITLFDPLEPEPEKLLIKYFMDRWFTVSEKVKRWFIIVHK